MNPTFEGYSFVSVYIKKYRFLPDTIIENKLIYDFTKHA